MPTYKWRLACDSGKPTHLVYEHNWTFKDQVWRARQATYCWGGEVDPARSSFGHRRLVLAGTIDRPSAAACQEYALLTARWVLSTIYGMRDQYGDPRRQIDPPRLDIRIRAVCQSAPPAELS